MKFKIFSVYLAENGNVIDQNCAEPHVWISVLSPGDTPTNLPPKDYRKDHLHLYFHDCETKDDGYMWGREKMQAISEQDAKDIINFVNRWKDKVSLICVNCEVGLSRSAGIVEALSLWLNGHDSNVYVSHYPNASVKSMILKVIREQNS